jgi:DNA-directed RNA polymerase sigma subunit (sigma70/sigma32)
MEMIMTNTADELRKQAKALEEIARRLRKEEMQKLRKEGWTLLEIGEKYKISKERVRQILDEKDG